MFTHLCKGVLVGIAVNLLDKYRRLSLQLLKIEAAKGYLHGVQVARIAAFGLLRMTLCLAMIAMGALFFHVGLFVLLPWTLEAKAMLGMMLGLTYVLVGCVVIRMTLSEKNWIEKSGLAKWQREIAGKSGQD
jgi:hypothetical protein